MNYKAMRDRIEDMVNDNHRDFIKAIISIVFIILIKYKFKIWKDLIMYIVT